MKQDDARLDVRMCERQLLDASEVLHIPFAVPFSFRIQGIQMYSFCLQEYSEILQSPLQVLRKEFDLVFEDFS